MEEVAYLGKVFCPLHVSLVWVGRSVLVIDGKKHPAPHGHQITYWNCDKNNRLVWKTELVETLDQVKQYEIGNTRRKD